ncbi:hypothetical protein LTR28_000533, partial [Elasticomyces elasticus]
TQYRRDDPLKFNYNGEKVRGVNLGGWFVLEPWITPSIFEATPDNVVDEYTLCQTLGKSEALNRLSKHWNTWITQDDFNQIAAAGLNHVRIPIGYWSVSPIDGEPRQTPGSQNGFDNSGRRGGVGWTQGNTVSQTITALNKIRDDHASHPAVAAIELLNEPMGPSLNMDVVRQFYMDGWGNLQSSKVAITIHDAFEGVTSWNGWGSGMWALLLDTHHYEIFDYGSLGMSPTDHVHTACGFGAQMASNNKWTVAGEWTGALTDCAKWLNGRGKGARYDGTLDGGSPIGSCAGKYSGTVAGLSDADRGNIRRFIEAQLDAFEKAQGWIFWTWKNEAAP